MEISKENVRIGHLLKEARIARNITQEEMACYLNLTKNHVSKLERGLHTISTSILLGYCNKLSFTPNDILCPAESTIKIIPELLSLLKETPQTEQRKIFRLAKAIQEN